MHRFCSRANSHETLYLLLYTAYTNNKNKVFFSVLKRHALGHNQNVTSKHTWKAGPKFRPNTQVSEGRRHDFMSRNFENKLLADQKGQERLRHIKLTADAGAQFVYLHQ